MSLTSLIREPLVAALFQEAVLQPAALPNIELLAPPLTRNYRRVGTAFDYLLRFYLQYLNPLARSSRWIAEGARMRIGSCPEDADPVAYFKDRVIRRRNDLTKEYLEDARVYHRAYLRTGIITEDLLVALLRLAGLDVAFRADPDKVEWDALEHVEQDDIADLRRLYELARGVDFRAQKACFLNPHFNMGSAFVGGADADIVLDSRIIDIKTTKNLRLDQRDLYQLVGYYLLLLLDGIHINGKRTDESETVLYADDISEITDVAIYFSRFGYLHSFSVANLLPADRLSSFARRFAELACPRKRERLRYWRSFRGAFALTVRDVIIDIDTSSKTVRRKRTKKRQPTRGKPTRVKAARRG